MPIARLNDVIPSGARDLQFFRERAPPRYFNWGQKLDNSNELPVVSPFASSAKFPVKRRGEIAELAFLLKAISLGFGVAKPWGDSDPSTTLRAGSFGYAQGRLLRLHPHLPPSFVAGAGQVGVVRAAVSHQGIGR